MNAEGGRVGRVSANHRDDMVLAVTHLRRAAILMDAIVVADTTSLSPGDRSACHRIAEASQAIHRAILAATECVEEPH